MTIAEIIASIVIVYWFARLWIPLIEEHDKMKRELP